MPTFASVVLDMSALEDDDDILWQCVSAIRHKVLEGALCAMAVGTNIADAITVSRMTVIRTYGWIPASS